LLILLSHKESKAQRLAFLAALRENKNKSDKVELQGGVKIQS